ncbi:MAG TPA: glutamine ABC transporter ATP-binding protein [Opitutae bacterium]|nr:glutamine ABC transporter ATP-binding protein [Opitutae bacterium]|tara:strand:+ start:5571 stop:6359 length:789 start_codon:yes stop_codon:yes gene_type:complete
METPESPLIHVQGLHKSYDDHEVLKNINVAIEKGDLVSIVGPSGCGKSTFLRCLNCLEILDQGTITIADVSLHRSNANSKLDAAFHQKAHNLREEVGMVFQGFNLFPHKTLLENVMLAPMVVRKQSRELARSKAMALLDKVGLSSFKDRYPMKLSGGQQQRAAIARALAMSPLVMLYDEPTSSLDPELVEEVLQVMRALDEEGMTQIVVTHEMYFARDASDYIIYMEGGEIVEISDEDEIFISPKDPRTKRFLTRYTSKWEA